MFAPLAVKPRTSRTSASRRSSPAVARGPRIVRALGNAAMARFMTERARDGASAGQSPHDRGLLAHEPAHVTQQPGGSTGVAVLRRSPGPPPIPSKLPGYLTDEQLAKRAEEIFESVIAEIAKRPKVNAKSLEIIRETFTIGVLQGHKNGKLVTMIAVNTSEHKDLVKAFLGTSEEFIDPIEAQKYHARFDKLTRSTRWRANVHSEQVLAAQATDRRLIGSRVGTSRPGCRKFCISTLDEFYPHVRHVNPAGAAKAKPGGRPLPSSPSKPAAAFSADARATEQSRELTARVKAVAAAQQSDEALSAGRAANQSGISHWVANATGGSPATEGKAVSAGGEAVTLADEAADAGKAGRAGKGAKALLIAGKAAEALLPSPLDVLGLWIDFFGSLAEAKEKLRQEYYMRGFCLGVAARMLRLDAYEATRMLQLRSQPEIGEMVAGFEGVRDIGRWQGVRSGWALWNKTNAEQRKVLVGLRRGVVSAKRERVGPNGRPLVYNFDDVLELALILAPTMEHWLQEAAEEERRRAAVEAARRSREFDEATWRFHSK